MKKIQIPILLVLLLSAIFKLYFSTQYVTYTDEILSAVVAKSISTTGVPVLPSGGIYSRAPLHHYMMSVPIGIWGIEYGSMRITSVIFSLVTLIAVYLLGRRVSSMQVALSAAFILSILSLFNQFALSGRMYMTFAALYTLSFYFFYLGFVKERASAKGWTILIMAVTMLSSEAGVLLGPIFAFALVVYHKHRWVKNRFAQIAFIVWGGLVWLILFYKIPGVYESFTAHSGISGSRILSFSMPAKEIILNLLYPFRALDKAFPISMPFFLVMTAFVLWKGEFRKHYLLVIFLPALIIQSFFDYSIQYRIIISLLPLYVLICCQFVETLIRWGREIPLVRNKRVPGPPVLDKNIKMPILRTKSGQIWVGLFFVFLIVILFLNKIRNPNDLANYLYQAIGYHDSRDNQDLEPSYEYLASQINSDDTVILTTLEYGIFFLGMDHHYYYLRQKKEINGSIVEYTSFEEEKDPYYGRPIIDSVEKLQNLIFNMKNPLWIVQDYKATSYVGKTLRDFIDQEFEIVFDDEKKNQAKVYRKIPRRE